MLKRPSFLNSLSKKIQKKINSWIPEKVHNAITAIIKQMIRTVLFGAMHTTTKPTQFNYERTGRSYQQKNRDL